MKHKLAFIISVFICTSAICAETTPYISKIIDFVPAPGQFINVIPAYDEGDTKEDIIAKIGSQIIGTGNGTLLSLGAWGGYIIVGFDHTIPNIIGEYDFHISGNAHLSYIEETQRYGGSCEPGIVMVSRDANNNGLADDEWFELAGSGHYLPETKKKYEVTYYKPSAEMDASTQNIANYILWKDNQGEQGYISKNVFHKQSYFPLWIDADSITFSGTLLPPNGVTGINGYTILYAFDWGYADNYPNNDERSRFKIEWAVDNNGNPVHLDGIDFIKIYTGVLQNNGFMISECSTEIAGITDLHFGSGNTANFVDKVFVSSNIGKELRINTTIPLFGTLLTINGTIITEINFQKGNNILSTNHLQKGIYLLQLTDACGTSHVYKLIK
ncbi:MAG TPA: PKD domain-containing protein [Paludibacteraceae bacterium]|jgi:hypothetical protein|nr:PKD domain-containing protein [Paludibacteraceae bacterium]HOH70912.1 PKD domain-containing protein [Paludibacteraceae bacterium]HPW95376.1 PKD domain-containing protein [Paludibacteraceae bacterium]